MLLDSMKQPLQNSVIIVGNGPSLLKKENGHLIDEFDIVVRFNQYTIKGFEKYVGVKTNYWFNTVNFVNKAKEHRMHTDYDRIVLHIWEWDIAKDMLFKSFKEFYKDSPVELIKTDINTLKEMQVYIDNRAYFAYSTGSIAIWMLLKEHPLVYITGFDWWESENHHYNDKAPRGKLHDPQKEYVFIKKLIDEGRVKMI